MAQAKAAAVPSGSTSSTATTLVSATAEPMEKSMPAVMMTMAWP